MSFHFIRNLQINMKYWMMKSHTIHTSSSSSINNHLRSSLISSHHITSHQCSSYNDMIFVCLCVWWETVLSTYFPQIQLLIQLSSLSSSSRHQLGPTAFLRAASQGHVDTVELLLDSGSDKENKHNVSTRRCITTYMHVYK